MVRWCTPLGTKNERGATSTPLSTGSQGSSMWSQESERGARSTLHPHNPANNQSYLFCLHHEFCGNHLRDVGRNRQLRDPEFSKLLKATARTNIRNLHGVLTCTVPRHRVARYGKAYANWYLATGTARHMPTGGAPHLPFCYVSCRPRVGFKRSLVSDQSILGEPDVSA